MVWRSFSISAHWPNVINIQDWSLPDRGYFITDDKASSGKACGGSSERWGLEVKKGAGWGECLEGEHIYYKGQRRTVMLLRQPQTPLFSLSPSAFCFSCQENWQADGMKKSGSSWASSRLWGHAQALKKKKSYGPPTWQNKWGSRQRQMGYF